ncbi:MAG: arginine--tRNA ligase [Candidatus Vogelbacteria bacterium]|nr:arginine--tRNA ligase [Candidatus Vogelbacteria bacterium]
MLEDLTVWLRIAARELVPTGGAVAEWDYPELARGDYATAWPLKAARQLGQSPLVLARSLAAKLETARPAFVRRLEAVPPGFVNVWLTTVFFRQNLEQIIKTSADYGRGNLYAGQKVLVEYTDPNPFKEFHIGHLMSNTIGEALSRLIEWQGAEVKRACYQGDVGLHAAKAIYGKSKVKGQKAEAWGQAYVLGAQAYDNDETAKQEIIKLNRKIYDRSDPATNRLYDQGRQASLDYFETIYRQLGTKFDFYFFESASGPIGKKIVEENLGRVFEKSAEAVVFRGERRDTSLHTRVFLTTEGLPTYEAKELGLAKLKSESYPHDLSLVVTGNEIKDYFQILLKALELIYPKLAAQTQHRPHGILRLPTGKMSSRTGAVITAERLIEEVKSKLVSKIGDRDYDVEAVALGAIKYAILKQAPGRDIIFNLDKSLSLAGDSGPYLQYTIVRARAVLAKAAAANLVPDPSQPESGDFKLERLLYRFPAAARRAAENDAPNLLVTYLVSLAASFNYFYAEKIIIDQATPAISKYRLALTAAAAAVLANGLSLLAIPIPERM